ncbi:2Fe-2S iron-sulfur cluster-binding protein [Pluralibacter gergoviae]|uniref:2Fe-2S iron-sulfur cluster-binding protein n=1 Tax=Pluralibacter gergoviae TaxID=61647 RepID=UPI001FF53F2F|nr:2Fe-2S iron-sulfur cluster-binding protein [Pluralibacter gergoviae]MCK1066543.1 2Fe-2S iron-sulfur cluster-binding protein [Pluralibacter gergoviae]MCV7759231.1 2Fe-2S iron-sulfur cluster-binding protein [Pluralibacter gergoviae]HDS1234359.1 2Fe-2S iron-sulfur cluster binding domain-containing protein [Pluralibacter gergoviae]HDS1239521.1 2Fe-2S iron-sulfur cluster binding domain-containing protein [Pluralibacter gergoviae]HDS1245242.1 2Fe-2S iron-sulfur cluster binding domain-containing p
MFRIEVQNLQQEYQCPADKDLLRGMEGAGKKGIAVGCRGGGCGICKIEILRGKWVCKKMSASAFSAGERQKGIVLACCCYPRGPLVLRVSEKMKYKMEKYGTARAG